MKENKIGHASFHGKEYPEELCIGWFDFITNTIHLKDGYTRADVKWWVFGYPGFIDGRMTYPSQEEYNELNDIVKHYVWNTPD